MSGLEAGRLDDLDDSGIFVGAVLQNQSQSRRTGQVGRAEARASERSLRAPRNAISPSRFKSKLFDFAVCAVRCGCGAMRHPLLVAAAATCLAAYLVLTLITTAGLVMGSFECILSHPRFFFISILSLVRLG
eukprot:scaffold1864_cov106-Isochrysis_galbana.AAC.18